MSKNFIHESLMRALSGKGGNLETYNVGNSQLQNEQKFV